MPVLKQALDAVLGKEEADLISLRAYYLRPAKFWLQGLVCVYFLLLFCLLIRKRAK